MMMFYVRKILTGPMILAIGLLAVVQSSLSASELIANPTFDVNQPMASWWSTNNVRLTLEDNRLCAYLNSPTNNAWDALVGLGSIELVKGADYRAKISLDGPLKEQVSAKIQLAHSPWTTFFEIVPKGAGGGQIISQKITAQQSTKDLQLVFELGGAQTGHICFDLISLIETKGSMTLNQPANITIAVNQLGYLPKGPKFANLVTRSDEAIRWELISQEGTSILNGMSKPMGFDPSSGLNSHIIDFSEFQGAGHNYILRAGEAKSHPFRIVHDLYYGLSQDALSYFYLVRSGTDISGNIAGSIFARPAGHINDNNVRCLTAAQSEQIYGWSWTCDYQLDVSGGWYDAGDFGKYAVNGGISVAQLMASYEHALIKDGVNSRLLKQGYFRTENQTPNLPDILAEAKWQLDFLMKMRVPSGKYQGMVHHKIHGVKWNSPPLWPHMDDVPRVLHPPSTAATLNVAAATAQAARLFWPFDEAYAQKLFDVAQSSYLAAKANPSVFAVKTSGIHGGGDYADDHMDDEFYWAAAELFISSGQQHYLDDLKASPYWKGHVFDQTGITWNQLAGWARLQLALVPNDLQSDDLSYAQRSVIQAADQMLALQLNEAFGLIYPASNGLPWGSNNQVLQNMIVTASAYSLTESSEYLAATIKSMDYILGRNALGQSYVTGYGTQYSQHQHARIFAQHLDPSFPPMPKGALAGGPNSWLSDKYARQKLEGCAPQACYIDHDKSFSTNEIAINWNAGLAYVASFLAQNSIE